MGLHCSTNIIYITGKKNLQFSISLYTVIADFIIVFKKLDIKMSSYVMLAPRGRGYRGSTHN
jgi:hypothetical protein